MKNNGVHYDKCCYEEMTKSVGGQSQPQPYWNESTQNDYERSRDSDFNQSGTKRK